MYVTSNSRVQVFTAEGKFLRMCAIGLDSPTGIAVDSSDMVYVSEGDHVSTLTPEGQLVRSFGHGEETAPNGLAVDGCGVVYVCNQQVLLRAHRTGCVCVCGGGGGGGGGGTS